MFADIRIIWEIENWPIVRKKSFLQSRKFHLAKYAWYFGLYPNGDNDESKGWVSIYLFIDTQSPLLATAETTERSTRRQSPLPSSPYLTDLPSSLSLPKGKFVNLEQDKVPTCALFFACIHTHTLLAANDCRG
jgi:hypothetical protein